MKSSLIFTVYHIAPPVIISNISSVSVIEGDDAILHCIADSEPVHNVTWTAPNGSNIAYNNAKYKRHIPVLCNLHCSLIVGICWQHLRNCMEY